MSQVINAMPNVFFSQLVQSQPKTDAQRMKFLPENLGGNFKALMVFENAVYDSSDRIISGGNTPAYWEFAKTENSFFMYPGIEGGITADNHGNYSTKTVDGKTFGIIVSIMTFSNLSFAFYGRDDKLSSMFGEHYHNLRNDFYSLVDELAYNDDAISKEEIEVIEAMSSAVYMLLD